MTGEILQRLREAYGLERKDVAEALGKSCYAVTVWERRGRSWSRERCRETRLREGADRQTRFGLYLDALRALRGKRAIKPQFVFCPPPGATHRIERQGIKEWARIVPMHGTLRGFEWRGGEWIRAAWVEGSNEFQAALLAARLPQRKHKVRAVAGGVDEYHHAMRE